MANRMRPAEMVEINVNFFFYFLFFFQIKNKLQITVYLEYVHHIGGKGRVSMCATMHKILHCLLWAKD